MNVMFSVLCDVDRDVVDAVDLKRSKYLSRVKKEQVMELMGVGR